jgi:hypothetical protein
MTALLYLVLISVATLTISVFLLKCAVRRGSDGGINWTDEDVSFGLKEDPLDLEVSARIFNPEDSDFVASETSRQFTRRFREERTALALGWLRRVRTLVSRLIRSHRRAAPGNRDLKPTDELKLVFEFLLFQLMSGILWCVIWVHGPLHAAKLVRWSLELAGKLRRITEEIVPVATSAAGEIIKTNPQVIGRTKAS